MQDRIQTKGDGFIVNYESPRHITVTGALPGYLRKVIDELNKVGNADMNHCKMAVEFQIKQHQKEH